MVVQFAQSDDAAPRPDDVDGGVTGAFTRRGSIGVLVAVYGFTMVKSWLASIRWPFAVQI